MGMPNKCWLYASLVIAKVGIVHEIHQKQITECMKGCGCKVNKHEKLSKLYT